jgi:hypothetical protein
LTSTGTLHDWDEDALGRLGMGIVVQSNVPAFHVTKRSALVSIRTKVKPMNETQPYQAPRLEQHRDYAQLVGVSIPIGRFDPTETIEEEQ